MGDEPPGLAIRPGGADHGGETDRAAAIAELLRGPRPGDHGRPAAAADRRAGRVVSRERASSRATRSPSSAGRSPSPTCPTRPRPTSARGGPPATTPRSRPTLPRPEPPARSPTTPTRPGATPRSPASGSAARSRAPRSTRGATRCRWPLRTRPRSTGHLRDRARDARPGFRRPRSRCSIAYGPRAPSWSGASSGSCWAARRRACHRLGAWCWR